MGQESVPFPINETCPPCPWNVFSETRKVTGHQPVVAKRRPILAQPFKAGTSSCRCVPPADKLPWVEDLKGDRDADYGSGLCSVLNKRVLTPFPFQATVVEVGSKVGTVADIGDDDPPVFASTRVSANLCSISG